MRELCELHISSEHAHTERRTMGPKAKASGGLHLWLLCTVGLSLSLLLSVSSINNPKIRDSTYPLEETWPCEGPYTLFVDTKSWSSWTTLRRFLRNRGRESGAPRIRLGPAAILATAVAVLVTVLAVFLLTIGVYISTGRL